MPNRLYQEKSLYLRQHQDQAVDWYPWGAEAWQKAVDEDKPVLLSIGYSACHWCHVMAKEAFSDAGLAELLNEHFVCIKVDREERPDIDQLYMEACRTMTGQGGWPLTILCGSDQAPFFAATYLTAEQLRNVCERSIAAWRDQRQQLQTYGQRLIELLRQQESSFPLPAGQELIEAAWQQLRGRYDARWGGFADAPKFPMPHLLLFLMRYGDEETSQREHIIQMVRHTLQCMARGGIYDQIGFGFSRYSVDEQWRLPHFEKMLNDNAWLTLAYLEAAERLEGEAADGMQRIAGQTLDYLLCVMQSSDGCFYTSEDADSEGEEGAFYLWRYEEIVALLGDEEGKRLAALWDIKPTDQHRGGPVDDMQGGQRYLPHLVGRELSAEEEAFLDEQRPKLLQAREWRIHPQRDEKILVAWNGLCIAALAQASLQLQEPRYLREARRAAATIFREMQAEEGRLYSLSIDGQPSQRAHAEDYACLIWGLLELYQACGEIAWLAWAHRLAKVLIDDFYDFEQGGFFFTSSQAEELIVRLKPAADEAHPSVNSLAAYALQKLGQILGDSYFLDKAEATRDAFTLAMADAPSAYAWMLSGLLEARRQDRLIVVAAADESMEAVRRLVQCWSPHLPLLWYSQDQELSENLQTYFNAYRLRGSRLTAYYCSGNVCYAPVNDVTALAELLRQRIDFPSPAQAVPGEKEGVACEPDEDSDIDLD